MYSRLPKRRKSLIRFAEYVYKEYIWPDMKTMEHDNDYYMSRALIDLVNTCNNREASLLRIYSHSKRVNLTELASLTFDFLKTSPKYHDDKVCMQFMEDNLISYYEVDNTKPGTYEM